MRCPRYAPLFIFALYAAFAGATYKTIRAINYNEEVSGRQALYVNGKCRFEVIPPPGWNVNLNPMGGLAMRMSPTNAPLISLTIAHTSVADPTASLTESDIANLKATLAANGFRMKTELRDGVVGGAVAYQAWGERTALSSNPPPVVTTNIMTEIHSCHIKDGFLHHLCLSVPTNQAAAFEPIFDKVCRSYASLSYKSAAVSKSPLENGGTTALPTYTAGQYRFQCATPDGWAVKTEAGRDAAVLYTRAGSTAYISIGITPVSIQSDFIEEWRIPALKKELTSGRPFTIESTCFTTLDSTTNWIAWGVMKLDSRQDNVTAVAEYHSYHIHKGFIIHLCLIAPATEAQDQLKAFDLVRATFRSIESAD